MKVGNAVRPAETGIDQDNRISKVALGHAWNWFSLHAGQRMQGFNFFLIAMAFLVTAYGTMLGRSPLAAFSVGLFGAWVAFWFNRMERRTKQLVRAGEAALRPFQEELARRTHNRSMMLLEEVEPKAFGSSSYSVVIDCIQLGTLFLFVLGALYAIIPVFLTWCGH